MPIPIHYPPPSGTFYATDFVSNLYIIDPVTLNATLVGPTGVNRIVSMSYDPIGKKLYGGGGGWAGACGCLFEIDMATGQAIEIGCDYQPGCSMSGMGFRCDGVLFVYHTLRPDWLAITDTATGAATFLGPTNTVGPWGNGIAFNQNDMLYHAAGNCCLETLDQTNGQAAFVVPFNFIGNPMPWEPRFNSLAFDENGVLYGIANYGEGPSGPNFLAIIDTQTGYVFNLGQIFNGANALVYVPSEGTPGDMNDDGIINSADLTIMLSCLNKSTCKCANGDMNDDGKVTILDIRQLIAENPLLARDSRVRRLLR